MKITPLDIRRQEFSRKMRGFDPEEVETFLEMVADEFEAVMRENISLQDKISGLDAQVAGFREMEKTLQDTIVTAQKAKEEAKSGALKEAEFIVKEAELRAERWIEEARQEVMALKRELATLRSHKASFIARLRALLRSQSELLNVLEVDPGELGAPSSPEGEGKEPKGNTRDDGSSTPESHPAGRVNTDGHERETFRASGPGSAEGLSRPDRRAYGGRNLQGTSHGPSGEG